MDLASITPVVLTFDEAPNIARTLEQLRWAERVVVLDSGSTDGTTEIARNFANVDLRMRPFDTFAGQYTYAVFETSIATEWVLALDADFFVPQTFVNELRHLQTGNVNGYSCSFRYCIHGRPLRGSLYPRVTTLFRPRHAHYVEDGHAHRVIIDGVVGALREPLSHDDRKPHARWLASQASYAAIEARKLRKTPWRELSWPDRVRLVPGLAPVAAVLYAGILRGCLFDGRAGIEYLGQRAVAEWVLTRELFIRRPR